MAEYPLIEIGVRIGWQDLFGEALPDTGYSGTVIIPVDSALEIEAASEGRRIYLADGSPVDVESWEGDLYLGDRVFPTRVNAFGDQFIIGREVLDQMEICFEFGRTVRIRFE